MELLEIRILDIVDIVLVALLLFYLYRLVRGTVAINIFIGIVMLYATWKLTEFLQMQLLSRILGGFLGVGMFALIVVFQQEIRKFLLMIGTTNFASRKKLLQRFNLQPTQTFNTDITAIVSACLKMSASKTGAIIVLKRNNNLEFIKSTGDPMNLEVNGPILESIFYKNSPLHDGAIVIDKNNIIATRVILPVSDKKNIPSKYGLRHRAALGITEKTDALVIVISEQTGKIVYVKNGEFFSFKTTTALKETLAQDISE